MSAHTHSDLNCLKKYFSHLPFLPQYSLAKKAHKIFHYENIFTHEGITIVVVHKIKFRACA